MKLKLRKTKTAPPGRRQVIIDRQKPAAFSYHSQRAERSDNAPKSRGFVDFWLKRAGFLIGGIATAVCVISILLLSSSPRIILLNSGSGDYFNRDQATYQQAASQDLKSSIWNRNKITVNTAAISAQLEKQFPELTNVSVTLPLLGHRPIIYAQTSQPAFIFSAVNGSYVLDAAGKALATSSDLSLSKLNLPVVTDQTGQRVTLGNAVLTTGDTTFIRTVIAELAAKQIAIGALILPSSAADELDVHLSSLPYYVKFNMYNSGDARVQAGDFLATQAKLKSENITPGQYIDVRVNGRAYYL